MAPRPLEHDTTCTSGTTVRGIWSGAGCRAVSAVSSREAREAGVANVHVWTRGSSPTLTRFGTQDGCLASSVHEGVGIFSAGPSIVLPVPTRQIRWSSACEATCKGPSIHFFVPERRPSPRRLLHRTYRTSHGPRCVVRGAWCVVRGASLVKPTESTKFRPPHLPLVAHCCLFLVAC